MLHRFHLHVLLALTASASSLLWLSGPAHASEATPRVEVHTSSHVEVRWPAVSDATSYAVEVSKDGSYGPWRRWTTTSTTTAVDIPLSARPYRDHGGLYRYKVTALNSAGSAVRSVVVTMRQESASAAVSW